MDWLGACLLASTSLAVDPTMSNVAGRQEEISPAMPVQGGQDPWAKGSGASPIKPNQVQLRIDFIVGGAKITAQAWCLSHGTVLNPLPHETLGINVGNSNRNSNRNVKRNQPRWLPSCHQPVKPIKQETLYRVAARDKIQLVFGDGISRRTQTWNDDLGCRSIK